MLECFFPDLAFLIFVLDLQEKNLVQRGLTTIPEAAQQLATLLFGPQSVAPPTSSASSGSAPSLMTQGTIATANMPLDQLRQLALTPRDLSSSS